MVRCTADQLGLVGQPIDIYSLLSSVIDLELLHDNLGRAKPTNLHQIGLFGVTPKPNLLTKAVLGVQAFVLGTKSTSKATIGISFDQSFLSSGALVQHGLKGFMSAKVSRAEVVTKKTAGKLRLVSKNPLGRREASN